MLLGEYSYRPTWVRCEDKRPSPYDGPAGHHLARAEGASEASRSLLLAIDELPWWAFIRRKTLRFAVEICDTVGRAHVAHSEKLDEQ